MNNLLKPIAMCALVSAAMALGPISNLHAQQIANPASAYCAKSGGESILKGSTGYCKLPNGKTEEEWHYFRRMHSKKIKHHPRTEQN